MKKIAVFFILLFSVLFSISSFAENSVGVYFNDNPLPLTPPAVIKNDRTMVPFRSIFEALGYEVIWDEDARAVYAFKEESSMLLFIGEAYAYKNDTPFELDAPPEIMNDYTMVPLRFIAENSGAEVLWNAETFEVYITYEEDIEYPEEKPEDLEEEPVIEHELSESVVMVNTDSMQGSGVVISADGLILTNFHVIEDAKSVTLLFKNGKNYTGEVKVAGFNIAMDIVVLKIDAKDLAYISLGDSDDIDVGDKVKAIGSPLGKFNTETEGTILSFNKGIIATSARIEHGSSGGGLFNEAGELIGITFSYTEEEEYFSIPVNEFKTMGMSGNFNLTYVSSMETNAITPFNLEVKYDDEFNAYISWSPINGITEYRVYKYDKNEGKYVPVMNTDGSLAWKWGYPYCMGINAPGGVDLSFKISSFKNGVESPLSGVLQVSIEGR